MNLRTWVGILSSKRGNYLSVLWDFPQITNIYKIKCDTSMNQPFFIYLQVPHGKNLWVYNIKLQMAVIITYSIKGQNELGNGTHRYFCAAPKNIVVQWVQGLKLAVSEVGLGRFFGVKFTE